MATVTIVDVAKKAGVGVGTVSRVLNNKPAVSQDTRLKVMQAMAELNYTPSLNARRLVTGKTLTIAVIAPSLTRPAIVERLRGIENTLFQSEYDLVLYTVETAEKRDSLLHDLCHRKQADGLIIITLCPNDQQINALQAAAIPTVLIDAAHPALDQVIVDNTAGGYLATKHLIDQGHQQIAIVSDHLKNNLNFIYAQDRYQGYRRALTEAGLPFQAAYHQQGLHSWSQAQISAQKLFLLPQPPTAIFATTDTQAIGVLRAAQTMGLHIPQDISLIGYDDIDAAEYLQITTIRQPLYAMGTEGVQLLLQRISEPNRPAQSLQLPLELVTRETTAPPLT